MITQMNRQTIKPISEDAKIALQKVAEQYGLILKQEAGRFSNTNFTVKFTFVCETEDGIPADFARLAPLYDLTVEDFGREFTTYNGTYRVTGINSRRPKYPVSAECVRTGKGYKFPASAVKRA
jgi:hypothetical protein